MEADTRRHDMEALRLAVPRSDAAVDADASLHSAPSDAGPALLRALLVGLDALAVLAAWGAAWSLTSGGQRASLTHLIALPVLALASVLVSSGRRLYCPQTCHVRAFEMQRVGQVALLIGLATALICPRLGLSIPTDVVLTGMLLTFLFTNATRAAYRNWLAGARCRGRFQRQVVIVGTNDEARDLLEHIGCQPQLGLNVVGVIGQPTETPDLAFPVPYLGTLAAADLVRASGASGVMIASTALGGDELNRVTRDLLRAGVHIHLSTGLRGFAAHRLRPQSIVYESILYLQPLRLSRWQMGAKRTLDLVVGSFGLLASLPLIALAALAIKLEDGGPVIFRQTRLGRGGKHFTILKLRTMHQDAESRYQELATSLASRSGPLVKLHSDPRVTKVGRLLRATSLDELPQFVNVLFGAMSMVGPRPNLLIEAESLDPQFLASKAQVRPGLTGLWQVEGRDSPSFDLYRRLDIFYVENWSMGLDLAVMLVTVQRVAGRAIRLVGGSLPSRRVIAAD